MYLYQDWDWNCKIMLMRTFQKITYRRFTYWRAENRVGIVAWLVGPGDGLQLDPVDLAEVTDSGPSHGDAFVVAEMELLVEVGFPPLHCRYLCPTASCIRFLGRSLFRSFLNLTPKVWKVDTWKGDWGLSRLSSMMFVLRAPSSGVLFWVGVCLCSLSWQTAWARILH